MGGGAVYRPRLSVAHYTHRLFRHSPGLLTDVWRCLALFTSKSFASEGSCSFIFFPSLLGRFDSRKPPQREPFFGFHLGFRCYRDSSSSSLCCVRFFFCSQRDDNGQSLLADKSPTINIPTTSLLHDVSSYSLQYVHPSLGHLPPPLTAWPDRTSCIFRVAPADVVAAYDASYPIILSIQRTKEEYSRIRCSRRSLRKHKQCSASLSTNISRTRGGTWAFGSR